MKKKLALLLFTFIINGPVFAMDKALLDAVDNGLVAKVEQLLCEGANPNYVEIHDRTPLNTALIGKHIDVAKMLIAHGADINLPGSHGTTPLMSALNEGFDRDFVRKLVWLGAQSDTVGPHNQTAFNFAKNKEIEKWLRGEIGLREAFIKNLLLSSISFK